MTLINLDKITRCLSVRQPYASAIIHGPKRVENRPRRMGLKAGDWIWLHASKQFFYNVGDWSDWEWQEMRELWDDAPLDLDDYPRGAIIGAALLGKTSEYVGPWSNSAGPRSSSQIELDADPWAVGFYCTRIEAVVALPEPVPAKGALGLWTPTADVLARCRAQLSLAQESSR